MPTITLTIPQIPHGRKSTVMKGVIEELTTRFGPGTTSQDHVPDGHEAARQIGKDIGKEIEIAIEQAVDRT